MRRNKTNQTNRYRYQSGVCIPLLHRQSLGCARSSYGQRETHTPSFSIVFRLRPPFIVGRDSSVGIATRYGLDGPGIESRWGSRFSAPLQPGPGVHPASYTMGTGSFPGVKRPGRGVEHPPPSTAEVKETVEQYLYSPSGPSWPVIG